MRFVLRLFAVLLIVMLTSCAEAPALNTADYNGLLINIKEFFSVSILLLSTNSNFSLGQAIARLYYGHYHIARLIYNNTENQYGNNHTKVWNAMPPIIKSYGEYLKSLRIKYDYGTTNIPTSEIIKDLKYIQDNQNHFIEMIEKLRNTIHEDSTASFFDDRIKDIESTYNDLLVKLNDCITNMTPKK